MTLLEISSPTERRRVIRYGRRDGNKVVHRWHDVQQVEGSLYVGNFREDKYHQPQFDLFIFFPEVKDGLFYGCMVYPNSYTPEKLMEKVRKVGVNSKEAYVEGLNDLMARDIHIGNAIIEFVRQWDVSMAEKCAAYRADRIARIMEQDKKRHAEAEAEAAREKAEAEARLQAEKAKYLGWADTMSAMRFGKVSGFFEGLVRVNGVVMTRRDNVISLLRDNWEPKCVDGVTTWRKVHLGGVESKPRTEYRLQKENVYYKVTKTEYEFARYIADHENTATEAGQS